MREKLDGREMGGASRHLTRFEEDIDRVDGTIGMTLMTFISCPAPQIVIPREFHSSQNLLGRFRRCHPTPPNVLSWEKGAISEA